MIKNLQSKENEIGLFNKWAGYWVNLESMNQCATFALDPLRLGKGDRSFAKHAFPPAVGFCVWCPMRHGTSRKSLEATGNFIPCHGLLDS